MPLNQRSKRLFSTWRCSIIQIGAMKMWIGFRRYLRPMKYSVTSYQKNSMTRLDSVNQTWNGQKSNNSGCKKHPCFATGNSCSTGPRSAAMMEKLTHTIATGIRVKQSSLKRRMRSSGQIQTKIPKRKIMRLRKPRRRKIVSLTTLTMITLNRCKIPNSLNKKACGV